MGLQQSLLNFLQAAMTFIAAYWPLIIAAIIAITLIYYFTQPEPRPDEGEDSITNKIKNFGKEIQEKRDAEYQQLSTQLLLLEHATLCIGANLELSKKNEGKEYDLNIFIKALEKVAKFAATAPANSWQDRSNPGFFYKAVRWQLANLPHYRHLCDEQMLNKLRELSHLISPTNTASPIYEHNKKAAVAKRIVRSFNKRRDNKATTIQSAWRKYVAVKEYKRTRAAITTTQSNRRKELATRAFKHIKASTVLVQSTVRMHQARARYIATVSKVVLAQAVMRSALARRATHKLEQAFSDIQRVMRGAIARRRVRTVRDEKLAAEHATRLEEQQLAHQQRLAELDQQIAAARAQVGDAAVKSAEIEAEYQQQLAELERQSAQRIASIEQEHAGAVTAAEQQEMIEFEESIAAARAQVGDAAAKSAEIEAEYQQQLAELERQSAQRIAAIEQEHAEAVAAAEQRRPSTVTFKGRQVLLTDLSAQEMEEYMREQMASINVQSSANNRTLMPQFHGERVKAEKEVAAIKEQDKRDTAEWKSKFDAQLEEQEAENERRSEELRKGLGI